MGLIVALDEVREHLDKSTTADDAELRVFAASVTPVVEDYVGDVEIKTRTERHVGGPYLRLRKGPVLSVTSIKDWLTDQVLYTAATVKLDTETGTVYAKDGSYFHNLNPYSVEYQSGRLVATDNIRMAAAMIIAHNWRTQRGQLVRFPGTEEPQLPQGFTYSVPRKALEYMRSEARNRVVIA